MKEVIIESEGSSVTAKLTCEIDHHTAKIIREQTDRYLLEKRPKILTLDFSGVNFMDSSGIGLIIGRVDKAGEMGAEVRIVGLSGTLMRLVRMSGVEKLKGLNVTCK